MTTDVLYGRDAYLRSCDAVVTAVTDLGVVLDRTVALRPRGRPAGRHRQPVVAGRAS